MLRLLSDENFQGEIVNGLRRHYPTIDLVRAQDVGLSAKGDPLILEWAAGQGRVLVTNDRQTMIGFAYNRVRVAQPMPGVIVLRRGLTVAKAIEAIAMAALASEPLDWIDQVRFLPF